MRRGRDDARGRAARPSVTRRGVALPAAMYLLLVLSGLILVSLADAGESHRSAVREGHHARALSAAELAVAAELQDWNVVEREQMEQGASGEVRRVDYMQPPWGVRSASRVTRLGPRLYWLSASGWSGAGRDLAERRLALLVEHTTPWIDDAAVIAGGDVEVGSGFRFEPPAAGDSCGAEEGTLIVASPAATVTFHGDSVGVVVREVTASSTLASLAGNGEGEVSPRPAIDLELPPGSVVTLPFAASTPGRVPVVVARGALTLAGGSGEGLLVVEGPLHIEGGVAFRGVILAMSRLEMSSYVASVTGTIITSPVSSALLSEGGMVSSRCAVLAALSSATRPSVVRRRAWVELW
jgi:hypothetical protein